MVATCLSLPMPSQQPLMSACTVSQLFSNVALSSATLVYWRLIKARTFEVSAFVRTRSQSDLQYEHCCMQCRDEKAVHFDITLLFAWSSWSERYSERFFKVYLPSFVHTNHMIPMLVHKCGSKME